MVGTPRLQGEGGSSLGEVLIVVIPAPYPVVGSNRQVRGRDDVWIPVAFYLPGMTIRHSRDCQPRTRYGAPGKAGGLPR